MRRVQHAASEVPPPMDTSEPPATVPLVERNRSMLALGGTFLGTSTSYELYQAIYNNAAKLVEFTGFQLSLYDPEGDLATVVFSADDGEECEPGLTYPASDNEVIRTGAPTSIEDQCSTASLKFPGDVNSVPLSTLSVPLLCKNRVTGTLAVYTQKADAYRATDLELLERLGEFAAIAVENMRHNEALQRRLREAEKLEEIGRLLASSRDFDEVLDRVSSAALELLGLDGAGVWTHEDGHATVCASAGSLGIPPGTTWRLSERIFKVVVVKAQPFWIEDYAVYAYPDGLRDHFSTGSSITTPIMVGERVVGALAVRSKCVRRFTVYDGRMLERLAGQASVALNNTELHARIQALSLTDSLTGLPNRRHLQIHLDREFAAAQRGRKLALVLFDLDSFKHYNDTLGHVVGDLILQAFGEVLAEGNRAMSLVARYGGDEFVSVLSDSDEQDAHGYVARIEASVKADHVLASHGVTVSHGFAEFKSGETKSFEELIQVADRRMYEDKAAKRSHAKSPATG